jgi:hypothetical protein
VGGCVVTSEDIIQKSIVQFIRTVAPGCVCFAVPNGGARSKAAASMFKATGVLSGVSDLIVIINHRVIFAEVKTAKGRVSDAQREFGMKVQALGHLWAVWRSIDDVRNTFKALGFATKQAEGVGA